MPRFLGIDYGQKRIGLAVSDPDGRIASPVRVLHGRGSADADAVVVLAVADELEAAELVLGLPVHMDGTASEQTRITQTFADVLKAKTSRPVHLWDERLTSWAADGLLAQRELTRKKRKARQDAVAAAVLLTEFLEAARTGFNGIVRRPPAGGPGPGG